MSEEDIIGLISGLRSSRNPLIPGDDIAAFRSNGLTYAGTDSIIEGVHYGAGWLTPAQIAYKLFARNWSDFLCKGIKPANALLNLNLTKNSARRLFVRPFLKELDRLLSLHGIALIGGDTARSPGNVFTLTLLGSKGKFVPRQNKKICAGDLLLQLGTVGGSTYAVGQMLRGHSPDPRLCTFFTRPHIFPKLPGAGGLRATIDQSDSVDKSLGILAKQNGIHISVDLDKVAKSHRFVEAEAIPIAAEDLAVFAIAKHNPSPAFRVIGSVDSIHEKNPGVVYRHRGKDVLLTAHGFEHFHTQKA